MGSQEYLKVSWSHLSVSRNDREWRSHGKPRVPYAEAAVRSGVMIANGGLMVSQEYLKLEPPFGWP